MRKMLASTITRKEVPVDEQLGLLPFKVSELSNFKTVRTLTPRSTVLLTDGTEETTLDGAPYMVIGLMSGAPAQPEDRGRFAQQVAATIPGLRRHASPQTNLFELRVRRASRPGSTRSPARTIRR